MTSNYRIASVALTVLVLMFIAYNALVNSDATIFTREYSTMSQSNYVDGVSSEFLNLPLATGCEHLRLSIHINPSGYMFTCTRVVRDGHVGPVYLDVIVNR